jgi:hypothetical protein
MATKGSPLLQVRVDSVTLQGLRAYAVAENITKSELVRRIISGWVGSRVDCKTPAGGVLDTLNRIGSLIGKLELQLYPPVYVASGKPPTKINVQLKREELYRAAMDILREAAKLSENEELAAKAKARLKAMQLVTQTSYAAECILRDYQRDDILALVNELVKTNECLKEELRALRERAEATAPTN